ncbi:E3 ubiquitin-protein ligase TRIM39 [Esox lucius]|uniref:Tripartite motif-containing protein 35-like n=1 Tax=Esox lucius TaxID=8010 RepID=A0A6Q2XRL4_ESOLU|nr:E3 ubiquitin-protein ligase TRIM39 [Esox lucius]
MASNSDFQEEDFVCPICYNIFKDPVVLPCSHSGCKTCIEDYWKHKDRQECPVCRKRSSMSLPTVSLTLKRLCEVFQQAKSNRDAHVSKKLCGQHKEKLKLFCLEDEKPVCLVCCYSSKHTGHTFRRIKEVVEDCKLSVEADLVILKEKLRLYNETKQKCDQSVKYIEMQGKVTKDQVNSHIDVLNQILENEMSKRIKAVRKEEKQVTKMVQKETESFRQYCVIMECKISEGEYFLEADIDALLLGYKDLRNKPRTQWSYPDPQPISGAFIDMVKHLGNLQVGVTQNMLRSRSYYPVILDPHTAHRDVLLNETLTGIRMKKKKERKAQDRHYDNPERFNLHPWVLASEGFDSGQNSWVVEVQDIHNCCSWTIGVLEGSVSRHGVIDKGVWSLVHQEDVYTAHSGSEEPVTLTLEKFLINVKVTLDWDKGCLTFFDTVNDLHLHTFTHNFTEKVFPYLSNNCSKHMLAILPVKSQELEIMNKN